ncbi:MAG: hypothetical protein HYW70_03730 [Candidatus Nealsonbacteria bacterium]|nr:hypothetical protein [Candidatus Nealsonbacteria bacterium]
MSRGFIQVIFLIAILIIGAFFAWPVVKGLTQSLGDFLPRIGTYSPPPKKLTPPPQQIIQEKKTSPPVIAKKEPDLTPPKMLNPKPLSVEAGSLETIFGLETDEKSFCKYDLVSGLSLESMQKFFSETNATSHSVLITTLVSGKQHVFYVKCKDLAGNESKDDLKISFYVPPPKDTTPPSRRYPSPAGELPRGTKETIMTITTDEPAICRYSSDPSLQGSDFSSDEHKTYHYTNVAGLEDGKAYDYFVNCCDLSQNCNSGNVLISFKVAK